MLFGLLQSIIDANNYSRNTGNDWTDYYKQGANVANGISDFWDKFKNGNTNAVQKDIADQNLQFQRENLDYQKQLQREIFEREDTAYQRTANDMRMAGLNPLAMQGTNGAGEAIATEPMQNTRQFSDTSNMQAISGLFNMFNELQTANSNATLNKANANLINAQAANQNMKNEYEYDLLSAQLRGMQYDNIGKRFRNQMDNINYLNSLNDYKFRDQFSITDSMPDWFKAANILTHQGENNKDYSDWLDVSKFGKGFVSPESPMSFSTVQSMIDKNNDVKGALSESKILSGLLSLLGIKL